VSFLAASLAASNAPAFASACPNGDVRVGFSEALPDCRAYELVSPPGSEPNVQFTGASETGSQLKGDGAAEQVQAAVTGNTFSYVTPYSPSASPSNGEYLRVTRNAGGWSAEQMIPPQSTNNSVVCRNGYIAAYSPDLAKIVLGDGVGQAGSPVWEGNLRCGTDDPLLVANEPQGFQNLFLAEREAGPYELIDTLDQAPAGTVANDAWLQAASEDLSHVVFNESAQLTPDAPAGFFDLYEWSAGKVRLVTRLPDGTPTEGLLANGYEPEGGICCAGAETFTHAVSADGRRISFVANANLYLRQNADQAQSPVNGEGACTDESAACTVQVDAAQGGNQSGGGKFMWATPDSRKIFFSDENQLTGDSTAAPGEPDLYEYDLAAAPGTRLTDLTVNASEAANVLGVSGISDDGSHVYFVANGVLSAGANSQGDKAVAGQPNLYLWHGGARTFIATLDPTPNIHAVLNDGADWEAGPLTARFTPNGSFLVFNSTKSLTGYDNTDVKDGELDSEIFLYEAAGNELSCVSCQPGGAPSTAYARIPTPVRPEFGGAGPFNAPGYLQRSLSNDGRVFFHTAEKLLPGASNGLANVYEYDAGQLHLLSTGTSTRASYFYDASSSGDDVFFISSQDLPSGVQGTGFKVYDARVGGGFAEPPPPTECSGEACRGGAISPSPSFATPGSVNALGAGNLIATPQTNPPPTPEQIRRKRLARALKACRTKHNRHKRKACEAQAGKKYAAKSGHHSHSAKSRSSHWSKHPSTINGRSR
jgi:hypothetical protein